MEPEGSLPYTHELSTGPHPEPDQFHPYHPILSLRSILILFSHIRLVFPVVFNITLRIMCSVFFKNAINISIA
jgi:hypothetical protein